MSKVNSSDQLLKIVSQMNNAIAHRGPDSEGYWVDDNLQIAFGHRRLSILDLSENGSQPMVSASGRYILVYNGEVYNHKEIALELSSNNKNIKFKGHSDTEVLLFAFDEWGIENTIKKCVGMFSFAVWCKKNKILTLGRDRVGEKPLYFGWQGEGENKVLLFGSELKSLVKHPSFQKKINKVSARSFLQFSYVPNDLSIYENIFKIKPGHLLEYSSQNDKIREICYWSSIALYLNSGNNKYPDNLDSASNELESLLENSIKNQMLSDVPYGSFLSGGIDSTTITSLMQKNSTKKINTFSIGFKDKDYDESIYSAAAAKYLGTSHNYLVLTDADARQIVPSLADTYDEPFADSSQIPTIFLSQFAKKKVTVSLSGDGADELFGGYNRYIFLNNIWEKLNFLPVVLKNFISFFIRNISYKKLSYINFLYKNFSQKIKKLDNLILKKNISDMYTAFISAPEYQRVIRGSSQNKMQNLETFKLIKNLTHVEKIMLLDFINYLTDDILTKVDRASMSVSLETRMPFLDHRIIEFAFRLPVKFKIRNSKTKIILRNILNKYVPSEIYNRPKSGFALPIGNWIKTELKDWSEDLINDLKINKDDLFHNIEVQKIWDEHLNGIQSHETLLWNIFMYQSWLKKNF